MKRILFLIIGIYFAIYSIDLQALETNKPVLEESVVVDGEIAESESDNVSATEGSESEKASEDSTTIGDEPDLADEFVLIPKMKRHEYINSSSGIEEYAYNLFRLYKHFNDKYPGDAIDKDFSQDVAEMFTNLTPQEVYDREENIRFIVKNYRGISQLIEEGKAQFLAPSPPPIILEDDEYDTVYTGDYIEDDQLVVILDLKKVVGYGSSKRSFEAAEAKFKRENMSETSKKFNELKSMLSKLEFTKIPFYNIAFEDPFTGSAGLGRWAENGDNKVRIVSEKTKIGDSTELRLGLDFKLPNKITLGARSDDLVLDFSESENISAFEMFHPMPKKYYDVADGGRIDGYRGNFLIPLTVKLEDPQKPANIKIEVAAKLCDQNLNCEMQRFKPELFLSPGKASLSSFSNYIRQSYNILPKEQSRSLNLVNVVVDIDKDKKQTLRVELEAKGSPALFDIFVESASNIQLTQPNISIKDGKITARFEAVDDSQDLVGKQFIVSAKLNDRNIIREEFTAQKASIFDINMPKLSIGIILLGVLGGFILNFMPCVFPVLSLKLLGLTKFGATKKINVRRGFLLTLLGILLAFVIVIGLLIGLKSFGFAIGWGMQFQNTGFLVVMCFIMVLFIAQISGYININTPNWVDKLLQQKSQKEDLLNFLTGLLLVLLATPCSAPYLGTAIGFALAGSALDIIVVMSSVGIGLALPYIILWIKPDLAGFMPHPGAWVRTLNRVMIIMLLLTIIWLVSIVYAQTNIRATINLSIDLILFIGVLWFRNLLLETTENQNATYDVKTKVIRIFNIATVLITILLIGFAIYDVKAKYDNKRAFIASTKLEQVNQEKIQNYLKENKVVLLSIGADWCLTCKFNDFTVLNNFVIEDFVRREELVIIEIDWTNYNKEILDFMERYGRKGLPFYVIYSPRIPNGMVLPEILTEKELSSFIKRQRY